MGLIANVGKCSIDLPPDMAAELHAAVEDGDYSSVTEVVRDALHDWRMRRKIETLDSEELRRLVQEGIDSGPAPEADEVFGRLRARDDAAESQALAAAIAESDADPRTAPHEAVRDWLLRLAEGEFDAPPPEIH